MRSPEEIPNPWRARRWLLAAGLLLAPCAAAFACSTVEPTIFADGGDCVAGGCQQIGAATSSGSGVPCTVDPACTVSWKDDIYAGIFDGPARCTEATACHGSVSSPGGVTMETGKPSAALASLKAAQIPANPGPKGPYIVGCDQMHSGILCNMLVDVDAGATNAFGSCGHLMPLTLGGGAPLTTDQLTQIADWITCGAPDN